MRKLRVWAWSLGCAKNRVDTERFLGSLGMPVNLVRSPRRCDVAFINTCAFIETATRESLRAIFDTSRSLKRFEKPPLLVVAGCLPGRYGVAELSKEIPEVDLWLHSGQLEEWPALLIQAMGLRSTPQRGRILLPRSYAWLKIAEGCQRQCAYCTIPAIRGSLRSEDSANLRQEAEKLIREGARELILVAQDTTAWGREKHSEVETLPLLLEQLASLSDLRWLRMLYLYPAAISDELLNTIARIGEPVLPYLDIPLQHSQPRILKAMRRPMREAPLDLVARIRGHLPQAALRTTLMTGFPGESEADFRQMCDFVRQARFQHLGVFAFMAEEGTEAAALDGQVPEEVKLERKEELMAIQADISRQFLAEQVGKRLDVLVDTSSGEWPGLYCGHAWFQCPESDGMTWVSGDGARPGALVNAEIVDSQTYDLSALI